VLYVSIGTAGALFTFMLMTLARTPTTIALAVFGEDTFQSAAFAVESTIVLATIGEGNPLAATQYVLMAAPSLPITYMQAIDGAAYGVRGLSGALMADALLGVAACAVAGILFRTIQSKQVDAVGQGQATASV
jgi:MFS transporter, PAT family, beta-lactamase induction signal transducer AmpG